MRCETILNLEPAPLKQRRENVAKLGMMPKTCPFCEMAQNFLVVGHYFQLFGTISSTSINYRLGTVDSLQFLGTENMTPISVKLRISDHSGQ